MCFALCVCACLVQFRLFATICLCFEVISNSIPAHVVLKMALKKKSSLENRSNLMIPVGTIRAVVSF